MKRLIRTGIAAGVLAVGLCGSLALSAGVEGMRCVPNVSCGDRIAPCNCPSGIYQNCTVCTGAAVGDFCFRCPGFTCPPASLSQCGRQYKGICLSVHGGPLGCYAQTVVGTCLATGC
jgi:hypothetical protein